VVHPHHHDHGESHHVRGHDLCPDYGSHAHYARYDGYVRCGQKLYYGNFGQRLYYESYDQRLYCENCVLRNQRSVDDYGTYCLR